MALLNAEPGYRLVFGRVFPEVKRGVPINFDMFARAIAEFEFTLVFANAPLDRPGEWTHALMDLGATRCASRRPACEACPAQAWCRYVTTPAEPTDPRAAIGNVEIAGTP